MKIPFIIEISSIEYSCYSEIEKADKKCYEQNIVVKGIGSQKDTSIYWNDDPHREKHMSIWAKNIAKRIINAHISGKEIAP